MSEWSADVCSSDLQAHIVHFFGAINFTAQYHAFSMNVTDATGENGIGAHAGEQAEEDFRQTEAGLSFSDDDIERHQRFEPAAQRIALGQANEIGRAACRGRECKYG